MSFDLKTFFIRETIITEVYLVTGTNPVGVTHRKRIEINFLDHRTTVLNGDVSKGYHSEKRILISSL